MRNRDPNFGAKDVLKRSLRIRNARKPSVMEILVLGLQSNEVPISSARVPSKEERREVDR